MSENCAYESPEMTALLGETLRPGGFDLTDEAVAFCQWRKDDLLLDLGCGQGATVSYLNTHYGLNAVGLDPSQKLLERAKKDNPTGHFVIGAGEKIPFEQGFFDGVLSECTLSLMTDMAATLTEVHRVLKKGGNFFISDVYAKNPESLEQLKTHKFKSCMRGLYDLKQLEMRLNHSGFEVLHQEDRSDLLKQLLVQTIFQYGSMDRFWKKTGGTCTTGFQQQLKACRPGYFMMIVRKVD